MISNMSDNISTDTAQAEKPKHPSLVNLGEHRAKRVDWNECAQLYQSGILGPALAARYGCDIKTIYSNLRRMGVMRDTRGEAKARANRMMSGSGVGPKTILRAVQEAGGDEEMGIEEALIENDAKRIARVSLRHRRVTGAVLSAIEELMRRLDEAEYAKAVTTRTGLVVMVSASDEVKICANALKATLPLDRIVHGMDSGDAEEAAKRAEQEARKTNSAVQQVLELLNQGKRVAHGKEDRVGRTG